MKLRLVARNIYSRVAILPRNYVSCLKSFPVHQYQNANNFSTSSGITDYIVTKQTIDSVLSDCIKKKTSWDVINADDRNNFEAIIGSYPVHNLTADEKAMISKAKQRFYNDLRVALDTITTGFEVIKFFNEFQDAKLSIDFAISHEKMIIGFIAIDHHSNFDSKGELLAQHKTKEMLYELRYPDDIFIRVKVNEITETDCRAVTIEKVLEQLFPKVEEV